MSRGRACRGSACRSRSGGGGPSEGPGLEHENPGSWRTEVSAGLGLWKLSDAGEMKACCPPDSAETGPEDAEGGGQWGQQG